MNRRAFLRSTATTTATIAAAAAAVILPSRTARSADPAPGADEELLIEARERIARHRQARCAIEIRNRDGKPLPGATVRIEQLSHAFRFGCNFFMFDRVGDPELERLYRERFVALFNFATLGFYWAAYERERGRPNDAYAERAADWCRGKGIACKGHPLVWDHPAGSPRWLPDNHAEIATLSNARVTEIVTRFRERIDMWDVVNESTHLPDHANKTRIAEWGAALGNVPYTREPLLLARRAHPGATLLVNDYRLTPAYLRLLEALRDDAGKFLFDAVGLQSHMHDGGWPLRRIWEVCDQFARPGLPLHFTETTIVSGPRLGPGENWGPTDAAGEKAQAAYVPKFYTMLFAHPAVQALTWWDFSDRGAWQRAAAGFVRADMTPKPVYERLVELVKREWWTRASGVTGAEGRWEIRAFFGRHRVSATLPGGRVIEREIDWSRGGDAPQTVVLAAD